MPKQQFDAPRVLREILQRSNLKERDRRTLLAATMLSDPHGDRADDMSILTIVGNAIALAEQLGHDPQEFVLKCRKRVFGRDHAKRKRSRKSRRDRRERRGRSMRHFDLGEEDAALILRGDNTYEVYDPSGEDPEEDASDAAWFINCLAHFATDPHLMRELDSRYQRYIRDHLGPVDPVH